MPRPTVSGFAVSLLASFRRGFFRGEGRLRPGAMSWEKGFESAKYVRMVCVLRKDSPGRHVTEGGLDLSPGFGGRCSRLAAAPAPATAATAATASALGVTLFDDGRGGRGNGGRFVFFCHAVVAG